MGGDEDDSEDDEDEDDLDSEFTSYGVMGGKGKDWDDDAQALWEQERRGGLGLEDDELKELMADYLKGEGGARELAEEEEEEEEEDEELEAWELRELEKAKKSAGGGVKSTKKEKKDKKREKKAAAAAAADTSSSSSSKSKKSIFPTLEEPTPTFSNPTASTSKKSRSPSSSKPSTTSTSTLLEDPHSESTTLTLADSTAKASARHSLRFHTSKIDSASARRSSARQGRMGGDEDIPYRNKQAGRDAALRKNAPKGAVGQDTDLDGAEWGEEDRKTARDVKGLDRDMEGEGEGGEDMEGEDGYYQLVKKRKREEKEEKQEAYDEVRDASR